MHICAVYLREKRPKTFSPVSAFEWTFDDDDDDWSKATRLLESSRSRLTLQPRQRQNGKKTNTVENTQIQRQIQNTNTTYKYKIQNTDCKIQNVKNLLS